jgi:hypothetical protein
VANIASSGRIPAGPLQRARLARVVRGLRRFLVEPARPYPIRLVNWFMSK